MVIQGTPLVAVRAQFEALAAIVTRPLPPAALNAAVSGLSEKEHWAKDSDGIAHNKHTASKTRDGVSMGFVNMDLRVTGFNAAVSGA